MTPLEKDLVYGDLCARLPYNVYVEVKNAFDDVSTWKLDAYTLQEIQKWKSIKPYLRPVSSMTEEEKKEYHSLCFEEEREVCEYGEWVTRIYYYDTVYSIDWLNKEKFDSRGLIPRGLAIEVTKDNNPYKN